MLPIDLHNETAHSFVIFGATGKLASKKIFPALWALYRDNRLPQATKIYTYSRKKVHTTTFRILSVPYMGLDKDRDVKKYNKFWANVHCIGGEYDQPLDFAELTEAMVAQERKHNMKFANRIFYLALPPIVFDSVTLNISRKCISYTGWNRIIIEKPFARNDQSYRPYQTQLCGTFKEAQIYMIDHHLSKEVVQDFLAVRFSNRIWSETWNNQHISAVLISWKCDKPVLPLRADYFNSFGIIRDVMTNHMMQLVALLAMDQPYTSDIDSLRDEKVKVLKDIITVDMSDVVLGQYTNNNSETDPTKVGYLEHHYIPNDSITPTYALVVLRIQNKRWNGVPFILRAGKGLHEAKVEVRVQYKGMDCDLNEGESKRNELVLRMAPTEEAFMRVMLKAPGEDLCLTDTELNFKLMDPRISIPSNYQRLLLDVFAGSQMLFMRTDEQCEIWRIYSPLLALIEAEKPKPLAYEFGSRGPMAAYKKAASNEFVFYETEAWHQSKEMLTASSKHLAGVSR